MINAFAKESSFPNGLSWVEKLAVVTCKDSTDILLIKSILRDMDVEFRNASLSGDNKSLITFDSLQNLNSFVSLKDTMIEFFSSIHVWDKNFWVLKIFSWINILGIPLQFWYLELFKSIAAELGELIALSNATMYRSRLDVAFITCFNFSTANSREPTILD